MSALMSTYAPLPVSFSHGEGALLFDAKGGEYLDAVSGIAVTNLGHAHPNVTRAINDQAGRLTHCSNLFRIDLQEQAGAALTAVSGMDRVFFCNSGAEANEAAIKLARLHGHQRGSHEPQIIVLEGAFHGRTLAALSATGNAKIQAGFGPLVSGFLRCARNDLAAIERLADKHAGIAAVMLEPVQGESGVHPLDLAYLEAVAALCKRHGWLLIFDEVQSGNGRTGSYFYYQQTNVIPDVVTTAKALGNGVPIGACLAGGKAAEIFEPGHHGSTYGGNPLACAAALAVIQTLQNDELMQRAQSNHRIVLDSFQASLREPATVKELRGVGLMIGIELISPCGELVSMALQKGFLINVTAGNTIRLLPPLVMSDTQAERLGTELAGIVDTFTTNTLKTVSNA